jgi:SRSO17 transposase
MAEGWRSDLEIWLAPFLAALRHKTRARMCPAYIAGLIGPGDRKSVQPMAAVLGMRATTSCTISYRAMSGMRHLWRQPY